MADVADKCRKLGNHLKRADNSRKLLFDECEITDHYPKAVPVGNDTRWDSTVDCMEGVLYHKECFMRLARKGLLQVEGSDGIKRKIIPSISNFLMIKAGVKILKHCKITTKIFEQEKVPTVPLVTDRLFTMDKELEDFIQDKTNHNTDIKAVEFAEVLREELEKRFPEYGTNNLLNAIRNYLNPSLKGIQLKLLKKMDKTKDEMEEKLSEWKSDTVEDDKADDDSEDETEEPPKKLTPTQMLKKRMQQEEEKTNRVKNRRSSVFSNKIFIDNKVSKGVYYLRVCHSCGRE